MTNTYANLKNFFLQPITKNLNNFINITYIHYAHHIKGEFFARQVCTVRCETLATVSAKLVYKYRYKEEELMRFFTVRVDTVEFVDTIT
jgi:hypothetical protein